jgi:hypothetical protein
VHFISIKPGLSDQLSYVTIFHCSPGRSHKTGLTVPVKHIQSSYVIVFHIKACIYAVIHFCDNMWYFRAEAIYAGFLLFIFAFPLEIMF